MYDEKFEDTKGVIRNQKSKDRQYNGQKKKEQRINHDTENKGLSNTDPTPHTVSETKKNHKSHLNF